MKEWLIGLTLMAFGFIIGIVVLEFGLSRFAPCSHPYHELDKYIGWKGIPGKEQKYITAGRIVTYVKWNSQGFRAKEPTYEKKKGTFRIVVLGDSFTNAVQVPLEQTFPYILEERLNSEGSKRFEVINLGMNGFGTAQEYLTLKHYGLKYQPDFVILAFFVGNDVSDNSLALGDNPYRSYFVLNKDKLEEIPPKIKVRNPSKGLEQTFFFKVFPNICCSLDDRVNRVRESPRLANFLWEIGIKKSEPELLNKSKENEIHKIYNVYAEEYTPEWQNAWEVTKALILRISKELKENRIGFLVVVIPDHFQSGSRPTRPNSQPKETINNIKFDFEKPERILSEFLEENGINYLLLRPGFNKYISDTGRGLVIPNDGHWNADGHALASQLIYKKLKDDELVPIKGKGDHYY